MNNNLREEQSGEGSNGRFHTVQPLRDLESNWAVDLAQKLEEYLFKICCGEITSDDEGRFSVNFAEAALLLQGSIQVYSRNVEYLYSLVLHALEFISPKSYSQDALLASIAETEKQSELAARVSTWKQRIEHNLEEQDLHAPFDIHDYGWRVLDKLSLEADSGGGSMSFLDIVRGQEKHDVPRTFSALLQLVNNGNIDLDRGNSSGESVCYAAGNPFYVWLLHPEKRWEEVWLCSSKKRVKSPLRKGCVKGDGDRPVEERHSKFSSSLKYTSMVKSSQPNGKFCVKFGKVSEVRCTPDGKRR